MAFRRALVRHRGPLERAQRRGYVRGVRPRGAHDISSPPGLFRDRTLEANHPRGERHAQLARRSVRAAAAAAATAAAAALTLLAAVREDSVCRLLHRIHYMEMGVRSK